MGPAVRQYTFNPCWLVDFEPTTSCSGVQESTNRPPYSPFAKYELFKISRCQDMNSYIKLYYCLNCANFRSKGPTPCTDPDVSSPKTKFLYTTFFFEMRNSEFRIRNSEFRTRNSEFGIRYSELRIRIEVKK